MRKAPAPLLIAASLLGLAGGLAPALAQTGRTWVDPPEETGSQAAAPPSNVNPSVPQAAAKPAPARRNASQGPPKQRAVAEQKPPRQVRPSPQQRLTATRSEAARSRQIRAGMNAGLEIMTLRTIELPDGRRMQILTRPDPEDMAQFLDEEP